MKSITHENRRKFTITTIVSVLVLAILTTTLVFLLKKDTTTPANTIEVGRRINTSLAGNRKIAGASVWDGSSSTIWTKGSGTETDPYLIESAANLYYLSSSMDMETHYEGVYFQQTVPIDLNCNSWLPIGMYSSSSFYYFSGVYIGLGEEVSITGIKVVKDYDYFGFFGAVDGAEIRDVYVEYDSAQVATSESTGGLIGRTLDDAEKPTKISNCKVTNLNLKDTSNPNTSDFGALVSHSFGDVVIDRCTVDNITFEAGNYIGGIIGDVSGHCTITNCVISDLNVSACDEVGGLVGGGAPYGLIVQSCIVKDSTLRGYYDIGGLAGDVDEINAEKCSIINCTIEASGRLVANAGGIVGGTSYGGDVYDCYIDSTIKSYFLAGGIAGSTGGTVRVENCLVQGSIQTTSSDKKRSVGGLFSDYNKIESYILNNIVNADLMCNSTSLECIPVQNAGEYNYYNSNKSIDGKVSSTDGSRTEEQLKDPTSYTAWEDFDLHWIIDEKINNGIPFPRAALQVAQVTGFDGDGTESSPFQIKTTADLQGMQSYYNDYDVIDEYHWILINDIDISKDANNLEINWCPIAFEGGVISGFNGHFLGNNKTISGLTITEQYENVGLFGRLAPNATITNLTVTGTINWDQAKYVGGVVGLMEEGSTLTNCRFEGTITGYLNTGNYAKVGGLAGSYNLDAINGSANYDSYIYGTNNYTTFNRYSSVYSN